MLQYLEMFNLHGFFLSVLSSPETFFTAVANIIQLLTLRSCAKYVKSIQTLLDFQIPKEMWYDYIVYIYRIL